MLNVREIIVKQFKSGVSRGDIFRQLRKFKVTRVFVYRTIKRFIDTGSTENRKKTGRKRCVRTAETIKIVRERIRRNCDRSARKLAASLMIPRESVRKILRDDLGLTAFKKKKMHGLTDATISKRMLRSKILLSWHGGDEIIFSDEKLFTLQATFNSQNDRLWAISLKDVPAEKRHVPRYQNASSVMVWGAICKRGTLPLVFIEKGVKINEKYYLEEVLQKQFLPAIKNLYGEEYYCFQQDGAPSHSAKIVQDWCNENLTDFIPKDEWPPSSPDLNPLDFCIWGYMLQQLKNYKYKCLDEFKLVILKIWDSIPHNVVRAACNGFEKRLKLVIKAKGQSIE